MNKMQPGDLVWIKAGIVDYNDGLEKARVLITGYAEDKMNFAERYPWLDYDGIIPVKRGFRR